MYWVCARQTVKSRRGDRDTLRTCDENIIRVCPQTIKKKFYRLRICQRLDFRAADKFKFIHD